MGCRILYDKDREKGCLYCSTVDVVFGPIMNTDDEDKIEAFLNWLPKDARLIDDKDLPSLWYQFISAIEKEQCPDCEVSLLENGDCPSCQARILER